MNTPLSAGAAARYPSPLRYPGGKGKISNFMKMVFLKNDLVGSEYVEVFAGGASVALSLLFDEFASQIHINDLNGNVYSFWRSVLDEPEEICRRIRSAKLSAREWQHQKAIQADKSASNVDLAFSTFYLNRTSRSGILDGGPIGGKHQTGLWKLDARFNRRDLARRIEKIARFANRISLTRLDGARYIREVLPKIQNRFVYLDPPYFTKGRGLYEDFYEFDDHVEIAELVRGFDSGNWLVSYDLVPEILKLYRRFRSIQYQLNYSAGHRYFGTEVMFFGPKLRIPKVSSPAKVDSSAVNLARRDSLSRREKLIPIQ